MENLQELSGVFPPWSYIIAGVVVLLIIIFILISIVSKRRFKTRLKKLSENEELLEKFKMKYSKKYLLNHSALIEKITLQNRMLINILDLDLIWIEQLCCKKREKDLKRVLEFAPDKGLFSCFTLCLTKPSLSSVLLKWLDESEDFLIMRKLALSGKGEEFNGKDALKMFTEKSPQIREMTGDPEWAPRYFAYKILLYDSDSKSTRAVWDGFKDAHPLVRRTIAREITTNEKEKLYEELYNLLLDDPVYEVRLTARERINKDFKEMYKVKLEALENEQILHIIELMYTDSLEDENTALKILENKDLELRLSASLFLEKCGTLKRLFLRPKLNDQKDFNRCYNLLKNACDVNVTSFLSEFKVTENPATILIAARILVETGDNSLITPLMEKVVRLPIKDKDTDETLEIYETTVKCAGKRGTDSALRLLSQELNIKKTDEKILNILLRNIPERNPSIFMNQLVSFLKNPEFPLRNELREPLKKMPVCFTLPVVTEILKGGREKYPHIVRIDTLKLLGELKLPYCLQDILENLPILPFEEARMFTGLLAEYTGKMFDERVSKLLKSSDAKVRAAIISSLPVTGKTSFLKEIKISLKDADPDVRIACVWALLDFDDTKSLNQTFSMLRDPVERVRKEVARVLGLHGSSVTLDELKKLLKDENEVSAVKLSAINGLEYSKQLKSIDILIDKLSEDKELQKELISALSKKTEKNELAKIIDHFKDAEPHLRDKITASFKAMKEQGEQSIEALLSEEIASLKPYIAEILESSGYIESKIRQLAHRDPMIRRKAAEILSRIGTLAAFRGIVLAARDPDNEVRVKVVKALEALETAEGKKILEDLKNDPDKRVQKYTLWALERIKAKEL